MIREVEQSGVVVVLGVVFVHVRLPVHVVRRMGFPFAIANLLGGHQDTVRMLIEIRSKHADALTALNFSNNELKHELPCPCLHVTQRHTHLAGDKSGRCEVDLIDTELVLNLLVYSINYVLVKAYIILLFFLS